MIGSRTPFRMSFIGGGSDIKEFYKQSPEKYKYPENRSFTIISIKPADIIDSIQISEEVAVNEYKNFPEKYGKPEERASFTTNPHGSNKEGQTKQDAL